MGASVVRVGLYPARERDARAHLFAALEDAYPVRFEGREAGAWEGLDGLLAIGPDAPPAPAGVPCLHALGEERRQDRPGALALADHPALARPLRGAKLTDGWAGPIRGAVGADELRGSESEAGELGAGGHGAGDLVFATAAGGPAWTARGDGATQQLVAAAPAELTPGEALRERLLPGRCLALLALTHFLRSLNPGRPPREPLRAAFVLDDPNLHWPSYGHLRYGELSRHALSHGYHVVVAMVPLDGWLAHPRVVRTFGEHADQLSICVHGNDHRGPELGRVASDGEGVALAGQALRRSAAFQRRTGIPVDRVMVPPHEECSEPAARGLRACGYEAICVSRPYPWIAAPPERWLFAAPPERSALAAWESREIVAGGLPLLLRAGFNAPREELVLRAFLGQPLILYGHHDLLADGLDVFADAAAAINALGDVQWSGLAGIARAGLDSDSGEIGGVPAINGERDGDGDNLGIDADAPSRPRPGPLLRRLVSEGRDRAQAIKPGR